MNTVQLECFLAVSETLNFARAAEHLHITQPAVTHQINSLESEMDVKLFKRTTRTVELTEEGWSFFNDAKTILNMTHMAKARLSSHNTEEIRSIGIGCHSPMELSLLPKPLNAFLKKYPDIHPELKMVPFQALQNLLQEENIDVMMGFMDENSKKLPGVYVELTKAPLACIMSPSHPLSGRESLRLEDLKEGKLIICSPRKTSAAVARIQGQLIGCRMPSDVYFCDNIECGITLVQAGLGFIILPAILPVHSSALSHVLLEGVQQESFGLYYKTLQRNQPLKDFIQFMKEYFS